MRAWQQSWFLQHSQRHSDEEQEFKETQLQSLYSISITTHHPSPDTTLQETDGLRIWLISFHSFHICLALFKWQFIRKHFTYISKYGYVLFLIKLMSVCTVLLLPQFICSLLAMICCSWSEYYLSVCVFVCVQEIEKRQYVSFRFYNLFGSLKLITYAAIAMTFGLIDNYRQ